MVTDYESKHYRETARQINKYTYTGKRTVVFLGDRRNCRLFPWFWGKLQWQAEIKNALHTDAIITEQLFIIKHAMSSDPTEIVVLED